ncbi:MAG: polynucleotide adenylyltransferase PcnB, partial [Burkholderiaceae bacterium]
LHHGLLPLLDVILEQPAGERFVMLALSRTDERVRAGRHIAPSFLFATLLWHEVLAQWNARLARGEPKIVALNAAVDDVLETQTDKLAIQRRYTSDMREIWGMQPRFERRTGKTPYSLVEHLRFRAGYDFLVLRAAADEIPREMADWWGNFSSADEDERADMVAEAAALERQRKLTAPAETASKKRRRRGGGARGRSTGGAAQ